MLRLAEIPYLNCVPFYWNKNLNQTKVRWITAFPKDLGKLAKVGKIDAGPVSLVDSFLIEKEYEPLGNFGIAADRRVKSVLLFSKGPIHLLNGKTVGVTPESVTSVRLLQYLLEKKYRINVNYRVGFKNSDSAHLYIGDKALEKLEAHSRDISKKFTHVTDLCTIWHSWKKCPFVFARWMVKKDIPAHQKKLLQEWLTDNLQTFPENLSGSQKDYLSHFRYFLGPKELKAIQTFRLLLNSPLKKYN